MQNSEYKHFDYWRHWLFKEGRAARLGLTTFWSKIMIQYFLCPSINLIMQLRIWTQSCKMQKSGKQISVAQKKLLLITILCCPSFKICSWEFIFSFKFQHATHKYYFFFFTRKVIMKNTRTDLMILFKLHQFLGLRLQKSVF